MTTEYIRLLIYAYNWLHIVFIIELSGKNSVKFKSS